MLKFVIIVGVASVSFLDLLAPPKRELSQNKQVLEVGGPRGQSTSE